MGLNTTLNSTISRNEADSYYQHIHALLPFIRATADSEAFARYREKYPTTEPHLALLEMDAAIRAADPCNALPAATPNKIMADESFPVQLPVAGFDAFLVPVNYELDNAMPWTSEGNDPKEALGVEAYKALATIALNIIQGTPSYSRIGYETPGPLFPRAKKQCTKDPADNSKQGNQPSL